MHRRLVTGSRSSSDLRLQLLSRRGRGHVLGVLGASASRPASSSSIRSGSRSSSSPRSRWSTAPLPIGEGADREKILVLLLDAKHRAIGVNTVSVGSLTPAAGSVRPPPKFRTSFMAPDVLPRPVAPRHLRISWISCWSISCHGGSTVGKGEIALDAVTTTQLPALC
jgi:hypothetical protein